ncbi:CotH kinase family protein [Sphingobacterium siyangense]|uniref:CotH kinase family protein n=1 Tax=Sphingobacterium siyangense TaxID=459529 RepID=UPI003DA5FA87
MNFIQFLGYNPDKDGYVTPSKFDITIPSNGKMIISTLSGRTLEILDPTQDGDGMIYVTPESLDTDGSALSYKKYKSVVSGEGVGYGYEARKSQFEKAMYLTGPSGPQNSISPRLPILVGQKIEYSVGAEGLYLGIFNSEGSMVYSLEENQNKGQKKGTLISEWNGFVSVGNNAYFEDGSEVFVKVYTNKELLTIGDINKDNNGFGSVLGYDTYKKDTNDWLVFTEFENIYKNLIDGQLHRVSSTEVAVTTGSFWNHINPIKFKKGDLIRYNLTGFGYEPMYIILGSDNLNDVKFIKTFELDGTDGNNATTRDGELRVPYDCYIAFNVWNNPQITSLNYLKKGINGNKVTPQDLIEYSKPLSSGGGSVFKGRKITLSRPLYMEFKIRALPPLDAGDGRTPTEGEVDIVIDNRVVLTAKMKWSIQGHGSAKYNKKGYTFDFLNSEGKSLEIKFGDMISIDSFHLKAYATDTTHSRDVALGRIWRDMINTLPYPLSKVNNNVHVESLNPRKATIYTEDAKYHTDGIPVGVYVGESFFGLYTLRLKKTRDNYALDRDNKSHIFLDSSTYGAFYARPFSPVDWDLKSPRVSGYQEGGVINDPAVMDSITRVWDFMNNLSTRYAEHPNFWVLQHWVDFYIHAELFQNVDINGNNNNLMTWDNIHWSPIPYDLDNTVGCDPWVNMTVRTVRPQSLYIDFDIWGTFRTVFQTQIRARYTELRQSGFLTTKNLLPYFYNQVKGIPRDAYNDDLALWGTIWTNDQPSLEQTGMYIESSIQYLDTRWLNYPIGQVKGTPAVESDDLTNFSQVVGTVNNSLTASQTSAQLNTLYPTAPIGAVYKSITNNVEYTKISSTQWKKETINLV